MHNTLIKAIALVMVAALGAAGCQTYGGTAATGAGAGALAGGIIGHQRGRAGEGALIGAALGGLTGLVVHDIRVQRARGREETVQEYNYQPAQGEMLQFENARVMPSRPRPGTMADAEIQYALLGTQGNGAQVTESRVLRRGNQTIAELSNNTFTRSDGTWVSTMPFRVPENLEPGEYTIYQTVRTSQSQISGNATFTIDES